MFCSPDVVIWKILWNQVATFQGADSYQLTTTQVKIYSYYRHARLWKCSPLPSTHFPYRRCSGHPFCLFMCYRCLGRVFLVNEGMDKVRVQNTLIFLCNIQMLLGFLQYCLASNYVCCSDGTCSQSQNNTVNWPYSKTTGHHKNLVVENGLHITSRSILRDADF